LQVFFPKSGTPTKNEIVFTAPTGEKIHTRRHMEKFLKENGGPKISEFDWGNGETPRRSARIIEKAKSAPLVEHESEPHKKQGKTSADIENTEGKSNTVDGDLKASKENKNEEKI
jgi:hypothetical protein